MPIERKLAAIMFTDIAGYTALSAKDENKALELLDKQEQILTPIIEEFNGFLHNKVGDGLLFTFSTVTDAVRCGIKIQQETKEVEDVFDSTASAIIIERDLPECIKIKVGDLLYLK